MRAFGKPLSVTLSGLCSEIVLKCSLTFSLILNQITVQDLKALWERVQGGETVSQAVVAIEEKFVRMSAFVRGSPAKVKAHAVDKLSASIIEAGAVKTSDMPVPVYGDGNCLFRSVAFSMLGTSDKKWFSPASFLLLIALNSETH